MESLKDLNYGIVGLGIMGGSMAKAVRANILSEHGARGKIFACNRSRACLESALREGVIDEAFSLESVDEMLSKSDFVYVCLYPKATVDFLREKKRAFKSGSIVTDISGVKKIIVDSSPSFLRDDVDFVIGHPMAGGAKEGYANSKAEYFIGRNYILVPEPWNKDGDIALVKRFAEAIGFSRIVETSSARHDHRVAFTSQLCHVIASALVEAAEDDSITEFGGGSYEDLTRIAMINAPLWTELFLENKDELLFHIDRFRARMDAARALIADGDAAGLEAFLEDVRRRRVSMGATLSKDAAR